MRPAAPAAVTTVRDTNPAVSPDGAWVVFASIMLYRLAVDTGMSRGA